MLRLTRDQHHLAEVQPVAEISITKFLHFTILHNEWWDSVATPLSESLTTFPPELLCAEVAMSLQREVLVTLFDEELTSEMAKRSGFQILWLWVSDSTGTHRRHCYEGLTHDVKAEKIIQCQRSPRWIERSNRSESYRTRFGDNELGIVPWF